MSENFTDTELLIQLLDGELDEVQTTFIRKRMEESPSLKEDFEKLKLAKEAIKSYGLKNKISSIHTEMMHELKKDRVIQMTMPRKLAIYSMRVAAAVLFIISLSVLYQYFSTSPAKLFNENFEPFDLHESRGNYISTLADAYKNRNMQRVIQLYDTLTNRQPQDYILAGNAMLYNHEPSKAINAFTSLQVKNSENNTHFFEEDIEYYLALSYLHNNEPAKSLPLFEKINADNNHPYHQKISSWFLTKLRRLAAAK